VNNVSIKKLTVAITSAILFASVPSYAEGPQDGTGDGTGGSGDDATPITNPVTEPNAKRIKEAYPLGSMADWLQNTADQYALNPVNIRAGKHPDRSDPNDGPYDVIYIFPDRDAAEAWWPLEADPEAPMPTTIPDTAVAFIHWMLDNKSGSFPGVMSYSDIDGFKSKNCIMAAGDRIPVPGVKDGVVKDCSNPQGSSKRFKMNVMQPDKPVDLVYNVETEPLVYTNYDADLGEGLPTHDGTEESGRIYRILQKFHNASGMDAVDSLGQPVVRDGVRLAGFRVELGSGVGSGFAPIPNANNDGLEPDKSLGFELRPCMADHFFDVRRDRPGTGTNDCADVFDSTGQAIPQEIWLEGEYSTFSPTMYSFNTDKRTTPVGGWWDKRPSGINPPEIQTLGKLDSGYTDSADYTTRIDGSVPLPGYYGATTPNYFDIVSTQATGVIDGTGIDIPSPFGYMMYYGVLADGDIGILSQGVYEDPDGDPATEGDLKAWWDGDEYRWGADPTYDGNIDDDAFTIVPRETLVEWSMFPLQEEPDENGEFPAGPLYELGEMDDLAGLNVDTFVYLGRKFTGNQFTVRLTAVPVDSDQPYGPGTGGAPGFPMVGGEYGNQTPAWVANPAPALTTFINNDGVIIIRSGIAGEPLTIMLGDIVTGELPTAAVENLDTGEIENVTLLQDEDNLKMFSVSLPTVANGTAGSSNDGTMNVWPEQTIRVSYTDVITEAAPDGSDPQIRTDEVVIPFETLEPTVPSDDDSGCSCSTNPDGRIDPILPAAVIFALMYLGYRRWEDDSK